jgi:2-methylcitrate dehydratase PrpD
VVAATLVNNSAGPEIFTPEMLTGPQVLDLAARVNVSEDVAFTAMTPARRPARVTLHFKNGGLREKTVFGSKGDPDQPMSAGELEAKFHRLCDPTLGPGRAGQAWNELGRIDQWVDLDELMNYLVADR